MNCSFCNNNMYDATIDCVDRTLTIQYTSGSNSYNNMPNWTDDSDWCTRIHNDSSDFKWCDDCSILKGDS